MVTFGCKTVISGYRGHIFLFEVEHLVLVKAEYIWLMFVNQFSDFSHDILHIQCDDTYRHGVGWRLSSTKTSMIGLTLASLKGDVIFLLANDGILCFKCCRLARPRECVFSWAGEVILPTICFGVVWIICIVGIGWAELSLMQAWILFFLPPST